MTALSLAIVLALSARAGALVADLGRPAFRDREAAQAELLALGGPALSAVTKAAASPDPEVARRARGLAKDIGFRLDCERLLAGTPIRLDFTDAPLSTVLTELSKQSGYAIGAGQFPSDPDAIKVTIHTEKIPFWKAVEEVGKVSGMTVLGSGSDPTSSSVRYFIPDTVAVPQSSGEKILAWFNEVEGLSRHGSALDVQARGVLQVYRNDLKHYADLAASLENTLMGKKAVPGAQQSVDRILKQAENVHTAARNLFAAAGVRTPVGPGGRYAVVLGPANGSNGSAHAGVWVEPMSVPPTVSSALAGRSRPYAAQFEPSGPTVYLRVVPEPKIEWVRTTGVRVERATDDRGRAVVPKLTPGSFTHANQNDNVVLLGGGRIVTSADQTFRANPYYASVPLKSDSPAPLLLREFRGAVQGVVRASPGEVIARPIAIDSKKETAAQAEVVGANGAVNVRAILANVRTGSDSIEPSLTVAGQQVGETYKLDVALSYSYLHFAPAGGPQEAGTLPALVHVRLARGQIIQLDNGGSRARLATPTPSDSVYGLRVTDAAGRRFQLTATLNLLQSVTDGSGSDRAELTVAARPTALTSGPPVRIAWSASRLAAVEVPFDLKNVPVLK